jgi:hypothetical protein
LILALHLQAGVVIVVQAAPVVEDTGAAAVVLEFWELTQ